MANTPLRLRVVLLSFRRMGFVRVLTLAILTALWGWADLLDINRATVAELRALPGMGDAYAAAIVRRRPYKNKTQLRSKGVIPLSVYRKIKDQIVARQ